MKGVIYTLCLIASGLPFLAVGQYVGGVNDGYAKHASFNVNPDNLNSFTHFKGGSNDGFQITNALNINPDNLHLLGIYQGGSNDGYASELVSTNFPLANNLLAFNGYWHQKDVQLNWRVEATSPPVLMELERSTHPGNDFKKIHRVYGENQKENYYYLDTDVAYETENTFYYRLTITDWEGKKTYSPIIILQRLFNDYQCKIYPNPTAGLVTITMNLTESGKPYQVQLSDANGRKVYQKILIQAEITLELAYLSDGYYTLTVSQDNTLVHQCKLLISK